MLPVVADPLLAALPRHFDQPGIGASQRGKGKLLRTQRDASHRPVNASALVFAVRLETLSVLVDPAVVLARSSLRFGSADASGGPVAGPEVALETLGVVAWLGLATVFVQLSGTHFTTTTAIRDQTDSRSAFGKLLWA